MLIMVIHSLLTPIQTVAEVGSKFNIRRMLDVGACWGFRLRFVLRGQRSEVRLFWLAFFLSRSIVDGLEKPFRVADGNVLAALRFACPCTGLGIDAKHLDNRRPARVEFFRMWSAECRTQSAELKSRGF